MNTPLSSQPPSILGQLLTPVGDCLTPEVARHLVDLHLAEARGGLQGLLTPEDYASAKRTTFTAFYTASLVIRAMHGALRHFGVPEDATVLEPGCGTGNFMGLAPEGMRFIDVELDSIAGALYPGHDIRIEHFRDTRLPADPY